MGIEKYLGDEDFSIERTENIAGSVAALYDSEGDKVWEFPDSFTDEHIEVAVAFANHAFGFGVSIGSDRKAEEIRRALRIGGLS
ncbi:hypothetical protein ACET9P_11035 [Aeromonas veronii]